VLASNLRPNPFHIASRMSRLRAACGGEQVAVVLFDHVDAGAHQLGQQPPVIRLEEKPSGEGVSEGVRAARLEARGFKRGVPIAVAPVAKVEVAAPRRWEEELRVGVVLALSVESRQSRSGKRDGPDRAGGLAGELFKALALRCRFGGWSRSVPARPCLSARAGSTLPGASRSLRQT
jgi:hypothetical protein